MSNIYVKSIIGSGQITNISKEEFDYKLKNSYNKEVKVNLNSGKNLNCYSFIIDSENTQYYYVYDSCDLYFMKLAHRPENKQFLEKPHERYCDKRKRTRPWDNCWFSNKPHIINLTVEQAIKKYPQYMLWCYTNLKNIQWSVHTIKMFQLIK